MDLDGTLLVGDGPALDHAGELARLLDGRDPGRGTSLLGRVEAFLAGRISDAAVDAPDGYLAARSLALTAGLDAEVVSRAFFAHRERMSAGDVPFHAPDGAAALLAEAREVVVVALVTNAPTEGLPPILRVLGLADAFDVVVGDAGKPAQLVAIIDRLLGGDRGFDRVLSVGDIWENDLAPIAELGAATAHIDRHGTGAGTPTYRAPGLADLAPAIRGWVAGRLDV